MIVVVDCNVVISAGLAGGLPHQLLHALLDGHQVVISPAILEEYQEVSQRSKFARHAEALAQLVEHITAAARMVEDGASPFALTDDTDEKYLAAAAKAGARYVVTGNLKHYPDSPYGDVKVISVRALATQLHIGN